jgi:hypothetical protein
MVPLKVTILVFNQVMYLSGMLIRCNRVKTFIKEVMKMRMI